LVHNNVTYNHIPADFKGRNAIATGIVRGAIVQNQESAVVIMDFASRYITSPDNMEQSEVDSFTLLMQASLDGKDVKTDKGVLKNLIEKLVLPFWINSYRFWKMGE
jgi:hypothetical protein